MSNSTQKICLWSGPRNISTTLMYSFAQRKDTLVFDEPLYGYYLKNSQAKEYHPGAQEVLNTFENNGEKVIQMMLKEYDKPIVFFKNMTHHLLNLNTDFLSQVQNVFLTRHPKEVILSFSKVVKNPTMLDVGYQEHLTLLNKLQSKNITPIVLDSKVVLINPEFELKKLCKKLNIPFYKNMLHWQKGAIKEDGCWAKYWYRNIHNSTGFIPYKEKEEELPSYLIPLYDKCMPIYEKLLTFL